MVGRITKKKLITKLMSARYHCYMAIGEAKEIEDFKGLSNAFPVSKEQLPILLNVLDQSILKLTDGSFIGDGSGDGDLKQQQQDLEELYQDLHEFGETCRTKSETLQELFEAVADTDEPVTTREESYRKATLQPDGSTAKVEAILRDLLQEAIDLPASQLIKDEAETDKIREALKILKKCDPSLKDLPNAPPKEGVLLVNHGKGGMQFLHNGKGNQNHCADGGRQITGDGNTIHFT